jgi:lycopene beta-cyclase
MNTVGQDGLLVRSDNTSIPTGDPMTQSQFDLIFVGGGLASCLSAFRLRQLQPDLRVLVLEHGPTLGGNHTWSFFRTDLTDQQLAWIEPLIRYRWDSYEVRFKRRKRRLDSGYCSTNSEHFHAVMTAELDNSVRLNSEVVGLEENSVELASGERINGRCVIDGRGPEPSPHLALGFQKFTGQVLQLSEPHGLAGPIIMDATVPQQGDYRFVYTLPLNEREVLVEDTRYSNSPGLESFADTGAISAYAAAQGWQVQAVVRDEQGVLPITLGGDIDAFWSEQKIPKIGLRAALFHATTGYSFADAVRTADAIAARAITDTTDMYSFLSARSKNHWHAQSYWRLLNRMLFIAAVPDQRHLVMERFYGMRQPLIERFYAGRSTLLDKIRILTGKPPVAILPAVRCLPSSSARAFLSEEST